MFAAIIAALKPLIPGILKAVAELAGSKKAIATAATFVGVSQSVDWKTQLVTGAVGIGYVLAQGKIDHAKATTPEATK